MKTALTLRAYTELLNGTRCFDPENHYALMQTIDLYAPEALFTKTKSGTMIRVSGIAPEKVLWMARVLQAGARHSDAMYDAKVARKASTAKKYQDRALRAHNRLTQLFNR